MMEFLGAYIFPVNGAITAMMPIMAALTTELSAPVIRTNIMTARMVPQRAFLRFKKRASVDATIFTIMVMLYPERATRWVVPLLDISS